MIDKNERETPEDQRRPNIIFFDDAENEKNTLTKE